MHPIKKLRANTTTDCLWPYILSILSKNPTHAYTLRSQIARRFGFTPGTVTSYRVIYSLKKEGLVSSSTDGRKTVYSITPQGRSALRKAKESYRQLAQKL